MIKAHVFRTKMVGGGTSYDVYIPCRFKKYRPIAAGCYATVICRDNKTRDKEFYEVDNYLRQKSHDDLPILTTERIDGFQKLRATADRLALRILKKAYPECRQLTKMPSLWCQWSRESDHKVIDVNLPDYS